MLPFSMCFVKLAESLKLKGYIQCFLSHLLFPCVPFLLAGVRSVIYVLTVIKGV